MTREARLMSGILLITIPSIQYGGYFLLGVLRGRYPELELTAFQHSMFRAGHAHAGVIVILSLIAQMLVDHSGLSSQPAWLVRIGFPLSAILISGGFFFSAMGRGATSANSLIAVLYLGVGLLAVSLITLGVALIRR